MLLSIKSLNHYWVSILRSFKLKHVAMDNYYVQYPAHNFMINHQIKMAACNSCRT